MRYTLINACLDWVNNYGAIQTYAEHNGLTEDQARKLIILAREVFESKHSEE